MMSPSGIDSAAAPFGRDMLLTGLASGRAEPGNPAAGTDWRLQARGLKPAIREFSGFALLLAIVFATAFHPNSLLFHNLSELFNVVLAVSMFIIVLNSAGHLKGHYLLLVGTGHLFIGLIDLLHLLTYPGMSILEHHPQASMNFWLSARFLEALTILLALDSVIANRRLTPPLLLSGFAVFSAVVTLAILQERTLPAWLTPEEPAVIATGITYLVCAMLAVAASLAHLHRERFDPRIYRLLLATLTLNIVSELALALAEYAPLASWQDEFGHLLKMCACYCLYRTVLITAIRDPLGLMFRDLVDSRERLRLALSAANMEIFALDPKTDLVQCEGQVLNERGLSSCFRGSHYFLHIHPGDEPTLRQAVTGVRPEAPTYQCEYRFRMPDGSHRWLMERGKGEFDAAGKMTRLLGACWDIDERKRNEIALQRSEEELRQALAAAHMLAFEYDRRTDRISRRGNTNIALDLGAHECGGNFFARVHPEDLPSLLSTLDDLRPEASQYRHEFRIKLPDGSERWLQDSARGIFDEAGRMIGVQGVCADVHERKQAQLELARHASSLSLLLEIASGILNARSNPAEMSHLIHDKVKHYLATDVSLTYVRQAGEQPLELVSAVGVPSDMLADLERIPLDHSFCGQVAPAMQAIVADHRRIESDPLGGQLRRLGLRAYMVHPLLDLNGELIGTLSFGSTQRDSFSPDEVEFLRTVAYLLSLGWERERTETEIKRLNAVLEQRVEERTAALVKSNLELQRFAYVAAHDLQTPLRSIASFSQLVAMRTQDRLDPQTTEFLRQVLENTQRMQTLIADLLAYSRLDSQARSFEPTALDELMQGVLNSLTATISEAQARVICQSLPRLAVDRTQLAQVFMNLIANGIKYNTSAQIEIHITASRQGEEWLFAVRDNGIGIDARYHEQIFSPFKRLHSYHAYPGSGVGLAICQRVVERHGGRIWLESAVDKGSVFYFTLPAETPPAP